AVTDGASSAPPGGYRSTRQCRGFFEGEVARHVNERLFAQHRLFRQHPVEIGAEPVCQIVGLSRLARTSAGGSNGGGRGPTKLGVIPLSGRSRCDRRRGDTGSNLAMESPV